MVLKDGNKYACESCIRGHRVSGCNHTDRELHFIAPKGRPVKQCDHCRGARKSKSHHAKCDCGGKKERGEVKLDDKDCCCTLGDNCVCGLKNAPDLRVDTTVTKPSHARPPLVKGTSETHLTSYMNEHHKVCHKLKHSTASSSIPYAYSKKNGSGASNTPTNMDSQAQIGQMSIPHRGSKDDSALLSPSAGLYASSGPAQLSMDSLPLSSFSPGSLFNPQAYQQYTASTPVDSQDQLPFSPNESCSEQFINELMTENSTTSPAEEELLAQLKNNSEVYQGQEVAFGGEDSSFSPADLPLTSNPFSVDFPQPTSFSDESNGQSAPGLTAASSTTHSELGDANTLIDNTLDATNAFAPEFGISGMADFGNRSPTAVQKPFQAPTSEPTDIRRSLDVDTMRSLSTFPTFNDTLGSYFGNPAAVNTNAPAASNLVGSFPGVSGLPYDPPPTSAPTSNPASFKPPQAIDGFDNAMTSPTTDRPRSMPIPITSTYNPNTVINNLYPQLDEDFSAAAAWDPSALDIGSSSWQFPMQ